MNNKPNGCNDNRKQVHASKKDGDENMKPSVPESVQADSGVVTSDKNQESMEQNVPAKADESANSVHPDLLPDHNDSDPHALAEDFCNNNFAVNDGNVAVASPPAPYSQPDPFDPESLRINSSSAGELSVKKIITVVSCRKPNKQEFVRVRPGGGWMLDTILLEDQETREYYLVAPALREHVLQEVFPARILTAINRNGDLFLWMLKLPRDGRSNSWNDSALEAAKIAEEIWVRVISNVDAFCYDVFGAKCINIEPNWPDLTFKDMLKLCFKGRFIDSLEHPFLKKLRGEI